MALEPEQPEPEQPELALVRGPLLVLALVREPVLELALEQRAGSARPEMNWASRA